VNSGRPVIPAYSLFMRDAITFSSACLTDGSTNGLPLSSR
jgi:hypothetical protein